MMKYVKGQDLEWARVASRRASTARGQAAPPMHEAALWLLSTPPSGFRSLLVKYNFLAFSGIFLIFKIWSLDGPFSSRILTQAANPPMIIKHVETEEIT
jgi:hypothetical protein